MRARSPSSSARPRPLSDRGSRRRRRSPTEPAQQQLPTEPAAKRARGSADADPSRARAGVRAGAAGERPAARWLDPLPDQPARLERARDSASYLAVLRVVGVGGAGLNALDRMIDAGITQVDFVAVNTDIQQLQMSDAPTKIHIGSELTEGLGSGADPEIGRRAAEDGYDAIKRALRGLRHGLRHRR